jgi:allophanate hydrolase
MEGLSLNWQLVERGATLVKKTRSASAYRLYALSDGRRPGMVRESVNGKAIEVEVWAVPAQNFGGFVAAIPAPLGIGKVELIDGSWHSGFICDSYGLKDAKDITDFGGWRAWTATLARKLDSKI